ncbi:MAG: hypothetical protein VX699_13370 [Myxococcota bacterium]|nr:hypothetical protein [Myxococcota bacterium]
MNKNFHFKKRSKSGLSGGLLAVTFTLLHTSTSFSAAITDVADAADTIVIGDYEEPNPFDIWLTPVFEYHNASGTITREPGADCQESNARDCLPVDELSWSGSKMLLNLQIQIGIFRDLALTIGLPLVLKNSVGFDYADGVSSDNSSIDTGEETTTLFNHDYKSGRAGLDHLEFGLRFAPLSDLRDESKPAWVIFGHWASPNLSTVYKPASHGGTDGDGKTDLAIGDGIHRITFGTALSKRIAYFGLIGIADSVYRRGYIDPYLEISYTLPVPEQDLADVSQVKTNTNPFGKPPSHTAKVQAGFEYVPHETMKEHEKLAFDLGFVGEYFSEGRNHSIITGPLGELTYTEQFMDVSGRLAMHWRPHRNWNIILGGAFGYRTEHFLTSENIGKDGNADGVVDDHEDDQFSPYFYCGENPCGEAGSTAERSYDQIGFRFKDSGHLFWTVFTSISLTL